MPQPIEGKNIADIMDGNAPLSVVSSTGGGVPPEIAAGVSAVSAGMQGFETSVAFANGTRPSAGVEVPDVQVAFEGPVYETAGHEFDTLEL